LKEEDNCTKILCERRILQGTSAKKLDQKPDEMEEVYMNDMKRADRNGSHTNTDRLGGITGEEEKKAREGKLQVLLAPNEWRLRWPYVPAEKFKYVGGMPWG